MDAFKLQIKDGVSVNGVSEKFSEILLEQTTVDF
jgi:hypothetical protein